MEQKKSKVSKAAFWQENDSQYGKLYAHIVEMENGDKGVYNSKSQDQNKFVDGQTVSYEWRPPKEGKKLGVIKPVKPQQGNSPQQSQQSESTTTKPASKNGVTTERLEMVRMTAEIAKDIVVGRGDVSKDDYSKYFDEVFHKISEKLKQ